MYHQLGIYRRSCHAAAVSCLCESEGQYFRNDDPSNYVHTTDLHGVDNGEMTEQGFFFCEYRVFDQPRAMDCGSHGSHAETDH
jgi:hypothetical protein